MEYDEDFLAIADGAVSRAIPGGGILRPPGSAFNGALLFVEIVLVLASN